MLIRRFCKSLLTKETYLYQHFPTQILTLRLKTSSSPFFIRDDIYRVTKYNFSGQNRNDGEENIAKKKNNKEEDETQDEEEVGKSFSAFENFEDFIKSKTPIPINTYQYSSKIVFENTDKNPKLGKLNLPFALKAAAWSAVSLAIVNFSYPPIAIISAIPLIMNLAIFIFGMQATKNNIMKIELLNKTQVKVYTLSNMSEGRTVNIKDIRFRQSRQKQSGLPIFVSLPEPEGKKAVPMLLFLQPDSTVMPNVYLFKSIIHGEADEVAKYSFTEEDDKENE